MGKQGIIGNHTQYASGFLFHEPEVSTFMLDRKAEVMEEDLSQHSCALIDCAHNNDPMGHSCFGADLQP
jgi:hypothetical protein